MSLGKTPTSDTGAGLGFPLRAAPNGAGAGGVRVS